MSPRATACPLDCPDHCTLQASVAVTDEGERLRSLDGDQRNPLTAGFICAKVRRFADHVYGDDRIRTPLRRRGHGLVPISWDAALDELAERLQRIRDAHGGEAIVPLSYGGSNGVLTEGIVDRRLFRRLGASRLARTVCAAPSGRAQVGLYGGMPGVALTDYVDSRLVVIWGMNPSACGIHLVPIVKEARRRGARVMVVDPRRIPLARDCDLHLPLRPGTDLPLALGVARWLIDHDRVDRAFLAEHVTGFETFAERTRPWTIAATAAETGLPADDIETFARAYADASPAVIRAGWGIERTRNGGAATAAVIALPAIAGKFGVRGGGYTMSNSAATRFDLEALIAEPEPDTRIINMNQMGRALAPEAAPPVRLLFVYDCNPLATLPDQEAVRRGLAREDLFTVVFEQVMTDTAAMADLVLPATTFVEHDELRTGYGATVVIRSRPVVPRVGEARTNYEVFTALLQRLGLQRPGDLTEIEDLEAALVQTRPGLGEALQTVGVASTTPAPIPFVDTRPATADGRVHLVPAALDVEAPGGLYRYRPLPTESAFPLTLISPATRHTVSSTFGQLLRPAAALQMHPEDARARGLADGQRVRVFNALGEVHVRLRVTDEIRAGVVCLPKGLWCRHTDNGNTANALTPDALADLGGGATFNDARVQVAAHATPGSAPASRL